MLQVLADRWWVVLLRGILAIGAGTALLAWPGRSLVLLIFLIGISALVDGLACIYIGLGSARRPWWETLLFLLVGAAIIGAGRAWPYLTGVLLLLLLVGWAIMRDTISNIFTLGLIGVGFGIATLAWPGLTGILLLSLIAGWAIARGVMEIIVAIRLRKVIDNELMMGLSGLLSIGFGALLIMYPGEGALAMAMFIGAFLIAVGVTAVILSFRLKGLKAKLRGMA